LSINNVNTKAKCVKCSRFTTHESCELKTRMCLECSGEDRVVCNGCDEIFNKKHDILVKCAQTSCFHHICSTCVFKRTTDSCCSSCLSLECSACSIDTNLKECVACEKLSCKKCFLTCRSCGDTTICNNCKNHSQKCVYCNE
jgi:hypothetical protein